MWYCTLKWNEAQTPIMIKRTKPKKNNTIIKDKPTFWPSTFNFITMTTHVGLCMTGFFLMHYSSMNRASPCEAAKLWNRTAKGGPTIFGWGGGGQVYSLKNHSVHSIFTPWVVTSVITSFGVNIEWTGRDFTRKVVNFHSTGVRIEWLLNEWNLFTP